jgi:hypothetical protein
MKLLPALAATAVLAVPATVGAATLLSANSAAAPSQPTATGQLGPGDDNGGDRDRDQRLEAGDDHGSDAPEPGDDNGGHDDDHGGDDD